MLRHQDVGYARQPVDLFLKRGQLHERRLGQLGASPCGLEDVFGGLLGRCRCDGGVAAPDEFAQRRLGGRKVQTGQRTGYAALSLRPIRS